MSWLIVATGIVLAALVVLCCAALVEVFRQLAEVRRTLDLDDMPIPIGLQTDLQLSDVGVPNALAQAPAAIAIFLSPKCATCLAVAEGFRGGAPGSVWFIVQTPPHPEDLLAILSASADRVILDEDDAIAGAIRLKVTPAVLTTSYGEITRAQTVSSPRQVMRLIPTVFPADGGAVSALVQAPAAQPQTAERG
ncbi:MAG: hypothetical protein QOF50_1538 [Gaiellaceae bacterium]|jgi:hypothetical protein|nr:hypothetical protein [Gaiellaceae bacterium]